MLYCHLVLCYLSICPLHSLKSFPMQDCFLQITVGIPICFCIHLNTGSFSVPKPQYLQESYYVCRLYYLSASSPQKIQRTKGTNAPCFWLVCFLKLKKKKYGLPCTSQIFRTAQLPFINLNEVAKLSSTQHPLTPRVQ